MGLGFFFSAFYVSAHRPMEYNLNQSLRTLPLADEKKSAIPSKDAETKCIKNNKFNISLLTLKIKLKKQG